MILLQSVSSKTNDAQHALVLGVFVSVGMNCRVDSPFSQLFDKSIRVRHLVPDPKFSTRMDVLYLTGSLNRFFGGIHAVVIVVQVMEPNEGLYSSRVLHSPAFRFFTYCVEQGEHVEPKVATSIRYTCGVSSPFVLRLDQGLMVHLLDITNERNRPFPEIVDYTSKKDQHVRTFQ